MLPVSCNYLSVVSCQISHSSSLLAARYRHLPPSLAHHHHAFCLLPCPKQAIKYHVTFLADCSDGSKHLHHCIPPWWPRDMSNPCRPPEPHVSTEPAKKRTPSTHVGNKTGLSTDYWVFISVPMSSSRGRTRERKQKHAGRQLDERHPCHLQFYQLVNFLF